jgi:2',3'-cyclic-nucleotide 2'-phosphodiesterase (5'-nucleotidase family)
MKKTRGQRMMRRFVVSSVAAGLVLSTVALPAAAQEAAGEAACPGGAPASGFADVPSGNVHRGAIDCGVDLGVIAGTTPTTFSPARSLTRGQVASLIARSLDEADIDLPSTAGAPTFTDLGAPHADNIRRLAAAGVIAGRTDGSFGTQDPVRRDQLASLFVRTFSYVRGGVVLPSETGTFTDVSDGVHFLNIEAAFEQGFMQGKTDGTFAFRDATRRDQAASVVVRFLDRMVGETEGPFSLSILHANDGESALLPDEDGTGGVGRFVAQLDALRSDAVSSTDTSGAAAVTVSAGDSFLAGPELSASIDDDDAPFYDALVYVLAGFDAMTLGNHEFDFGPELVAEFVTATGGIPFISANLDFSESDSLAPLVGEGLIAPSTVVQRSGREIAIVGATTDQLPFISSPGDVITEAYLPALQDEVDAVRADGADVVLLSSHLQDVDVDIDLAGQMTGVDAVIAGGSGENLRDGAPTASPPQAPRGYPAIVDDADGVEVPIVTVPGGYADIGNLVLEIDGSDVTVSDDSALVTVDPTGPTDPLVASLIEAPVGAAVAELAETVIGETEVPLDGDQNRAVRQRESNLGDLFADALLTTARENAAAFDAPVADIAVQNGGGIRNNLVLGAEATPDEPVELTLLDTFQVAPFSNFVSVAEIDVDILRSALERSVSGLPAAQGQFGQWAGIEFRYDASQPAQVVSDGEIVTEGERIVSATVTTAEGDDVDVVVGGETADIDDTFVIASNDFTLRGGDTYPFSTETTPLTNVGRTYQQALVSLIRDTLEGVVTAEEYPNLTFDGADLYNRFGPIDGTFVE